MGVFRGGEQGSNLLPEYGKWRLENYAQSFRDLAYNFTKYSTRERERGESRGSYLARRKEADNWQRLGERFGDVATLLETIAEECYSYRKLPSVMKTMLSLRLKSQGLVLKDAYQIHNKWGRREYSLSLATVGTGLAASEDVAKLLSEVFHKKILPEKSCSLFIGKKPEEYLFEEQGTYYVLTGRAGQAKDGEEVSGDNGSFFDDDRGRLTVLLSDGTGSGREAGRDSGRMIDLAEKYLEAGFDRQQMLGLVEGMHLGNGMENRMPTLDLCEMNLCTGECWFSKYGSAPSFVIRGDEVERIDTENLLPGFELVAERKETRKNLGAGDRVIMMTDGVADKVAERMLNLLKEYKENKRGYNNPTTLAGYVLDAAIKEGGGKAMDDMTVMVVELRAY